jgi:hypothetical protein
LDGCRRFVSEIKWKIAAMESEDRRKEIGEAIEE